MAIIFPDPTTTVPVNTFSPTSVPPNTTNSLTYVYDPVLGVWTSSAGGGGGGVGSVAVTAPITDTGTATAPIIGISAATTAATGSVQLADATAAAAGTSATLALTAATGVPKTPADMSGALYLPGGNDGARPAPATGMLRYNNQGGTPVAVEYYDGSNWTELATGGGGGQIYAFIRIEGNSTYTAPTSVTGANVAAVSLPGDPVYDVTFTNPVPTVNYSAYITLANGAPGGVQVLSRTVNGFTFRVQAAFSGSGVWQYASPSPGWSITVVGV